MRPASFMLLEFWCFTFAIKDALQEVLEAVPITYSVFIKNMNVQEQLLQASVQVSACSITVDGKTSNMKFVYRAEKCIFL